MDFGIGFSNLFGMLFYFNGYYTYSNGTVPSPPPVIHYLCQGQALVTFFSTYASELWTVSLAVYMYLLVFQSFKEENNRSCWFIAISYILNYSLAAGMCLWLLLTGRLGHSWFSSSGWCGLKVINKERNRVEYFVVVVGYDMWIYLTVLLCSVLYFTIFIYLKVKVLQIQLS